MEINVEPVTREDRIYEILKNIAELDNDKVGTYITSCNKSYCGYGGYIYTEIMPDKKLAEDLTHAMRQYKIRLLKEIDRLQGEE